MTWGVDLCCTQTIRLKHIPVHGWSNNAPMLAVFHINLLSSGTHETSIFYMNCTYTPSCDHYAYCFILSSSSVCFLCLRGCDGLAGSIWVAGACSTAHWCCTALSSMRLTMPCMLCCLNYLQQTGRKPSQPPTVTCKALLSSLTRKLLLLVSIQAHAKPKARWTANIENCSAIMRPRPSKSKQTALTMSP